MQQLRVLIAGLLVPGMVSAAVDCDFSTAVDSGATCESFAGPWGLSVADLERLNPGIVCPDLDTSKAYCVIGSVNDSPPVTTTLQTSTRATTSTAAPTNAPSNSPQMPGLSKNCDRFYQVSSGDQCDTIARKHGISTAQFMEWNSEINDKCSNLWLDYYVCVHVPGAASTKQPPPAEPTQTPSGPTPQMPGVVKQCHKFHEVRAGDSCWSISKDAGITLGQIRAWNTQLDSSCSNLWLGYYVCTGA